MDAADLSLWRALLDPDWRPPDLWRAEPPVAAAARLAGLVTPALAASLLAPVAAAIGHALIDPEDARRSRLLNRFTGGAQRAALATIAAGGISVVCMKGFAFAHTIYADPDLRTIGDLDILVAAADLDRIVAILVDAGFAFGELPLPAWGFISEASFMPLESPDGACSVDLHVEPDCYPAYRSLTAARVFAEAADARAGDVAIRIPAPAHALLLCLTNAAKDKFGPFGVRKLIDAALLIRATPSLDWDEVRHLASEGHFLGPARVALGLLVRLGLPPDLVPADLGRPPRGPARAVFERLVRDHASMFAETPSAAVVLLRELTVCTEPDVAVSNALRRLRGLFRPATGLPRAGGAGR